MKNRKSSKREANLLFLLLDFVFFLYVSAVLYSPFGSVSLSVSEASPFKPVDLR